ncbi:hypothetical protein I315_04694 [Cryptococcus gattii Ru294]|nr:hypothetical protein I315_04694 [Cryptococcus gattii Ru294]
MQLAKIMIIITSHPSSHPYSLRYSPLLSCLNCKIKFKVMVCVVLVVVARSNAYVNLHSHLRPRPSRRRAGINLLGVHRGMQSIRRGCTSRFRGRMLVVKRKKKRTRRQRLSLGLSLLIHPNQRPKMGNLKLF